MARVRVLRRGNPSTNSMRIESRMRTRNLAFPVRGASAATKNTENQPQSTQRSQRVFLVVLVTFVAKRGVLRGWANSIYTTIRFSPSFIVRQLKFSKRPRRSPTVCRYEITLASCAMSIRVAALSSITTR